MGYYAVSCLDDAVDATKAFLLPVDRGRWLRLAVVVFFLSGGTGAGSAPNAAGQVSAGAGVSADAGELPVSVGADLGRLLPLVVGLAVVVGLVALLFVLVGSVMEFVLIEALRTETVAVRTFAGGHLRDGLALFLFRVVLGALVLGLVAGLGLALVVPALDAGGVRLAGGILLVIVVAIVVGLVAALAHGLTVEFVVPIMVHEDRGLVDGWRRFWPVLRGNLAQFAVYVVVRFALTLAVGLVASFAAGIVGLVLAVPFVLLGGLFFVGLGGPTVTTGLVVGAVVVAYVLVMLAVVAVVQVPLKTFTRYYELLVLGDVESDLDLVADRRAAVRAE